MPRQTVTETSWNAYSKNSVSEISNMIQDCCDNPNHDFSINYMQWNSGLKIRVDFTTTRDETDAEYSARLTDSVTHLTAEIAALDPVADAVDIAELQTALDAVNAELATIPSP